MKIYIYIQIKLYMPQTPFTLLPSQEQRAYLLEIFCAVQEEWNEIYKKIYDYLIQHETISEDILHALWQWIEKIENIAHDEYYINIIKKMNTIRSEEVQVDIQEKQSAENLLTTL